ncbi:MAG: GNAT family N-acetyltransferase [Roseimicrobium sp.]
MSHIEVVHLFEKPEHLPTVAGWIYEEWWTGKPGYSPQGIEKKLWEASDPTRIPLSLLATVDGKPAGTVNLIESDDEERPHLRPWLAALLVRPEFQNRGIGAVLVHRCVEEAKRLGIEHLYLGTRIPDYYRKLGAEIREQAGTGFWIMRLRAE